MRGLCKSGFTLIELLTVILVIGILVGLLFPALYGVREQAMRRQAGGAKRAIQTAVRNYHYEYGKWPIPSADVGRTSNVVYEVNNYEVVRRLTGSVPPLLDIADYATDGLNILDPWREPYMIKIDTDDDDDVTDYRGDGGVTVIPRPKWKWQ